MEQKVKVALGLIRSCLGRYERNVCSDRYKSIKYMDLIHPNILL